MEIMPGFLQSKQAKNVADLHLPRYGELPTLDLYMDQVISVVNGALRPLLPGGDGALLTPTMVGNYVKQKVVSPPVKKRYTRHHLVGFLAIALLKQVFSIAEVSTLIRRQTENYGVQEAYDYFCSELEAALQAAFGTRQLPTASAARAESADTELLRSAVFTLVNKIYVQKFLEYVTATQKPKPELEHPTKKEAFKQG